VAEPLRVVTLFCSSFLQTKTGTDLLCLRHPEVVTSGPPTVEPPTELSSTILSLNPILRQFHLAGRRSWVRCINWRNGHGRN